ncbi:hypothetical protein ACQ33O_11435 [Ferruginibacter sp. SUN002]|uniref:hypothetical protein n=1 Tax=Ferruginibacter sp. SUN002 TaxID=2937789 RepID=UPI003D35F16C
MAITIRFFIVSWITLLSFFESKSQKLRLCAGSVFSTISKSTQRNNSVYDSYYKSSYHFGLNANFNVTKKIQVGIGLSYYRLGNIEITDGGYSQNNEEILPQNENWSIVKYRDLIRLNYIDLSFFCKTNISKKCALGLNLNVFLLKNVVIKRNIYVSTNSLNQEYAAIIWYEKKTTNTNKVNIAPEIFFNYKMFEKTDLQIGFSNSITPVYKNSINKNYHQIFSTSIIHTLSK